MMYVLSVDPFVEVSTAGLKYLKLEYAWVKKDRDESFYDALDVAWYAMSASDMDFMNHRGYLSLDEVTWHNGNGFQWNMLAQFDAVPELE